MPEQSQEEKAFSEPPIRARKCPSCQAPANKFVLSAFPLPIEQFVMPWLASVNKEVGWSVRPFGSTDLNELQFLAFTNFCPECGHISWWDFPAEELEQIVRHPSASASIVWNYEPRKLIELENKLSEDKKWIVSKLLDDLQIKRDGNESS